MGDTDEVCWGFVVSVSLPIVASLSTDIDAAAASVGGGQRWRLIVAPYMMDTQGRAVGLGQRWTGGG